LDEDECEVGALAGLVPLVGSVVADVDVDVDVSNVEVGVGVDCNDDVVIEGAAMVLFSILQKNPVPEPPSSQVNPRGQHSKPHSGKDTVRSFVCSEELGKFAAF
jgi:hypothetical protein